MKTFLKAGCIALASTLPIAAQAECDAGETIINFSHASTPDNHPKGIAATLLRDRVNAEMDGKACMRVFPNSTLFEDNRVIAAMLQGDVQLAAPALSRFESFTRRFRIYDLPFMFNNVEALEAFQASPQGQEMLNSMRNRGLQGLAYWHNGMKQMSATKPLTQPSDASGLRFAVEASEVLAAQMEAIGGDPRKMSFTKIYASLQQGIIDGQENTWSNIYSQNIYKVQDGATLTNHGVIDYLVIASIDWLNALPDDTREQFLQILAEVTEERNKEANRVNNEAKEKIIAAGGVVRELSDAERAEWVNVMKPVWAKFQSDVGASTIEAVQEINRRVN